MSAVDNQPWIERYRANGVTVHETNYGSGPVFVVQDEWPESHFQVKISAHRQDQEDLCLSVSIAAEWSDKCPGELANYTPAYENRSDPCLPGELTISDDGLLRVWVRQRTASHVVIHIGWSVLLPKAFVEPLRKAITLAEDELSPLAVRDLVVIGREPTEDEQAGINWWNGLEVPQRAYWLAAAGSAAVVDAFKAFKLAQAAQDAPASD